MLNKKVLLGSLVAGAMLLPMTSNAGFVTGPCVNCHTMHATDGAGGTSTPNAQLLNGDSCQGCHAVSGDNNASTGLGTNGAPQVDDSTNPNLAGFFTRGDFDSRQHNPSADLTGFGAGDDTLGNAPGGTGTLTTCVNCHTASAGGHHGTNGTTIYRMLFDTTLNDQDDQSIAADYGNRNGAGAAGIPNASATTYDADAMNGVCNRCHSGFHTEGTSGAVANQWDGTNWLRHPTDIDLGDTVSIDAMAVYNYSTNYNVATMGDVLPLGTSTSAQPNTIGTVGSQTIMCITCHLSHGGPYDDLLRFNYTNQSAGDDQIGDGTGTVTSIGCESCHDYGATAVAQDGM